jgi:hypothetical protein
MIFSQQAMSEKVSVIILIFLVGVDIAGHAINANLTEADLSFDE